MRDRNESRIPRKFGLLGSAVDPYAVSFLTALPDNACDRAADGLQYGPSIKALVEIFEREDRASQAQAGKA